MHLYAGHSGRGRDLHVVNALTAEAWFNKIEVLMYTPPACRGGRCT